MGGQDKGLMHFQGRPLVAYSLDALRQVADTILVNANRNQQEYARFGYPVISDLNNSFDGPLAGLLSAMHSAKTEYVLTVPCDCPRLDGSLLGRLYTNLLNGQSEICAAYDGERMHPVFLIAKCSLSKDLAAYLESGHRKVETWLRSHKLALSDYSDCPELFININTQEELSGIENA